VSNLMLSARNQRAEIHVCPAKLLNRYIRPVAFPVTDAVNASAEVRLIDGEGTDNRPGKVGHGQIRLKYCRSQMSFVPLPRTTVLKDGVNRKNSTYPFDENEPWFPS